MKSITIRLRSGFGGLVPPICDEAANTIDELMNEIECLVTVIEIASRQLTEDHKLALGGAKWGHMDITRANRTLKKYK